LQRGRPRACPPPCRGVELLTVGSIGRHAGDVRAHLRIRRRCSLTGSNALILPAKQRKPDKCSQDADAKPALSKAELRKLKQIAQKKERRQAVSTVRRGTAVS